MPLENVAMGRADEDPAELERLFPEPPIDHLGRYLLAGRPYARCTTVAKALDSTFLLDRWGERQVLNGLRIPALYTQLVSIPEDDRDGLNRLAAEAKKRVGAEDRAGIGTALHRVLERVHTGQLPLERVHPHVAADVSAADLLMQRNGLVPLQGWTEAVVAIPGIEVAGTIDRLVVVESQELAERLEVPFGARLVLDLKTSRVLDWSYDTFAMQVAIYSRATHLWDRSTDRLAPLEAPGDGSFIDQSTALILHLPAGEGAAFLYRVRLDAAQVAVDLALEARRIKGFGKADTVLVDSEDPQAVLDMQAEVLRRRAQRMVELVPSCAPIIAARFGGIPTFSEALARKHRYSEAELGTIDAILSDGESAMGLPFTTDQELADRYGPDQLTHAFLGIDRPGPEGRPQTDRVAGGASSTSTAIVCSRGGGGCQTIELPQELPPGVDPEAFGRGVAAAIAIRAAAGLPAGPIPPDPPDPVTSLTPGVPLESYGDVPPLGRPLPSEVPPAPPYDYSEPPPSDDPLQVVVEAVRGAFRGSTVVSSRIKVAPELQALIDRIHNLPRDLRGAMDAWAARRAIPNLLTAKNTQEQLDMIEAKLAELEERQAARVLELCEAVPEAQQSAIYAYVGIGPYLGADQVTADEVSAMYALVDAFGRGWLQVSHQDGADTPPILLMTEQAKVDCAKAIAKNHGSAAAAKLACARWAGALGRPKEWRLTTVKAMAEHPVIGPVMALGPAIFTPDDRSESSDNPTKESE